MCHFLRKVELFLSLLSFLSYLFPSLPFPFPFLIVTGPRAFRELSSVHIPDGGSVHTPGDVEVLRVGSVEVLG